MEGALFHHCCGHLVRSHTHTKQVGKDLLPNHEAFEGEQGRCPPDLSETGLVYHYTGGRAG